MSYGRFPQVGAAARWRVGALLAGCVLLLAATLSLAWPLRLQPRRRRKPPKPGRTCAKTPHSPTSPLNRGCPTGVSRRSCRTARASMRFGTNNGLNRFDGYTVVAYPPRPGQPAQPERQFHPGSVRGSLWDTVGRHAVRPERL